MKCENHFCIYWKSCVCVLDEVSLDIQGRCQECIYVEVAENILSKERDKILQRYEEEYKLWDT